MSLIAFFLNFSDYTMGKFSLADIALIVLTCLALQSTLKLRFTKQMSVAITLILAGSIGGLFLNEAKSYFSIAEYLCTFVKLLFYMTAVLLVPHYLIARKADVVKILRIFLYVAVAGAVMQLCITRLFGVETWPLYSLGGNWFGLKSPDSMFVNNGMIRARSFYSEPAAFAVGITLIFLLLLYKGSEQFVWKDNLIYVIGILTANSFSGYGMAVMAYAIYFFDIKSRRKTIRMVCMIVPGILFVIGILTFNGYLRGRIINLFLLKDASGVVRTVGGMHFLKEIPFYGVGLGNQSLYYHSLSTDIREQVWYSGSGEFYNIILVSIITMGYVGAAGLLFLQICVLKRDMRLFMSLMITHFATGRLYTSPLWVFMILYLVIVGRQKDCMRVYGVIERQAQENVSGKQYNRG